MDVSDGFKYDVRIRARLLAKGLVTEAEVTKHIENLTDVQPQIDLIDLAQPALTNPEDRERPAPVAARVAAPRPLIAAVERLAPLTTPKVVTPIEDEEDDDLDDEDDDDDEDEDEDEGDADKVAVKAAEKAAVPAPAPVPAPVPKAAPDDDEPADDESPVKDGGEEE